jgi:hypothetical protein
MKTNDEVRRLNLCVAIARFRTAEKLAEAAGVNSMALSQVRTRARDSKSGTPKKMGDLVARKIESALDEGVGWIDTPHPTEWKKLKKKDLEGVELEAFEEPVSTEIDTSYPVNMADILTLTCETAQEYKILLAYRFGDDIGRVAIDAAVDEIHNRLRIAARRKA